MNTAGAKGAEASGLLRFVLTAGSGTTLLHGAIAVLGLDFSLSPLSPALYLYLAGLAVPSLAGIALTPKGDRIAFIRRSISYRAGWSPLAAAASAQLGILSLAWLTYRGMGGTQSPEIQAGAGFAVLALGQIWVVLGEEFGWRDMPCRD